MYRPIIYLDTSDISNFADLETHRASAGALTIYTKLLAACSSRKAEFRYSLGHLYEILNHDLIHRPIAVRKAAVISQLCSSRCFLSFDRLWELELDNLLTGNTTPLRPYSDDGNWYPHIETTGDFSISEFMTRQIEDLINTSPAIPSYDRKRVLKKLVRNGRLQPKGIEIIRPHLPEVLKKLKESSPVSDEFYTEQFFLKMVQRLIPQKEIKRRLLEGIMQPSALVGHYYHEHDPLKKIIQPYLNLGAEVIQLIERFRGLVEENPGNLPSRAVRSISNVFLRQAVVRIVSKGPVPSRWPSEWIDVVMQSEDGRLPSIDFVSRIFKAYVVREMKSHRTVKRSDAGDVLHLMYFPYVDLMRLDRYFADVVCNAMPHHEKKVVNSIDELPDRIATAIG